MHKDAPPSQQQQQQQAKAKPDPSNTSFDFSPHGGVTFKENPNLNLQMVGTGYGGDDSHATSAASDVPRLSQPLSKARRRVSRGTWLARCSWCETLTPAPGFYPRPTLVFRGKLLCGWDEALSALIFHCMRRLQMTVENDNLA